MELVTDCPGDRGCGARCQCFEEARECMNAENLQEVAGSARDTRISGGYSRALRRRGIVSSGGWQGTALDGTASKSGALCR
jgi:hypothetical protein